MTRYAIIENGRVSNLIEADSAFAATIGAIDATGGAIGDLWDGAVFAKPPAPPPVVPQSITMRQARVALSRDGKLATVNTAIAGMAGQAGEEARIEWEFSSEVQRDKPLVAAMGAILALNDAQLDALFVTAATL